MNFSANGPGISALLIYSLFSLIYGFASVAAEPVKYFLSICKSGKNTKNWHNKLTKWEKCIAQKWRNVEDLCTDYTNYNRCHENTDSIKKSCSEIKNCTKPATHERLFVFFIFFSFSSTFPLSFFLHFSLFFVHCPPWIFFITFISKIYRGSNLHWISWGKMVHFPSVSSSTKTHFNRYEVSILHIV